MSGTKWSEETTVKFVNEYVHMNAHECLWNIKNPKYKNKPARIAAYKDIENAMNLPNFTEKEITNKIKNLRSTYSQELKKIKDSTTSGAGTDSVYIPSLKWFSILDAVLRSANIETRTSQSNLEVSQTESTADISSRNEDTIVGNEPITPSTNITPLPQTARKRKLKDFESLVKKIKDVSETVNTPLPDEHEFDIFGRSVAAQLKALPLAKALETQQFLQNHISKVRLQLLASSSINSEPSPSHSSFYTTSTGSTMLSTISSEANTELGETWENFYPNPRQTPVHNSESLLSPHSSTQSMSSNVFTVQDSQQPISSNILARAISSILDN